MGSSVNFCLYTESVYIVRSKKGPLPKGERKVKPGICQENTQADPCIRKDRAAGKV